MKVVASAMENQSLHRRGAEDAEDAEDSKGPQSELTKRVIGAAIEVHRVLGPGLLEGVYQRALQHELALRTIGYAAQRVLPVSYKGMALGADLRLDLVVAESVIVEIKSVRTIEDVHRAQLLSYLRLSGLPAGLLLNFNVAVLRQGIHRMVNTSSSSASSASSAPLR